MYSVRAAWQPDPEVPFSRDKDAAILRQPRDAPGVAHQLRGGRERGQLAGLHIVPGMLCYLPCQPVNFDHSFLE
jgi:hypothetical protein